MSFFFPFPFFCFFSVIPLIYVPQCLLFLDVFFFFCFPFSCVPFLWCWSPLQSLFSSFFFLTLSISAVFFPFPDVFCPVLQPVGCMCSLLLLDLSNRLKIWCLRLNGPSKIVWSMWAGWMTRLKKQPKRRWEPSACVQKWENSYLSTVGQFIDPWEVGANLANGTFAYSSIWWPVVKQPLVYGRCYWLPVVNQCNSFLVMQYLYNEMYWTSCLRFSLLFIGWTLSLSCMAVCLNL